jgi:D-glycero-D-manno-heptose 1,7-bisphosphate phosphatase
MTTTRATRPAVFLDRDGVLTDVRGDGTPRPRPSPGELRMIPGAAAQLDRLHGAGYALVVVTNQPDVARGAIRLADVEQLHRALASALPLDAVYCCPHDTAQRCGCRKPEPGMLLTAATEHSIALARSWMIGDRWVDVAAARRAAVRAVLIERAWSWEATSSGAPPAQLEPDARVPDLATAVSLILDRDRQKS